MSIRNNELEIILDYNNPTEYPIRLHQCDRNTRKIYVTCINNGQMQEIDASTTRPYIKWLKPDGKIVLNDCKINSDGTILVECSEQMLLADGYANGEIMLVDQDSDQVIHTMPFKTVIQKSVYPDDRITSSDEFCALNNLLIKIKDAEKFIAEFPKWEAAENLRKQAETERQNAEAAREQGFNTDRKSVV